MKWQDRVALIAIAEVLAEHLESCENMKDNALLPSDRVRGAIKSLTDSYADDYQHIDSSTS
jgi:hypothetical protein